MSETNNVHWGRPKQKKSKGLNKNLHNAKRKKNDEFYTQRTDIEKELAHYKKHFKNKTVLCNCDDPRVSDFFRYFSYNFEHLGLKKLITTCYKNQQVDLFSKNNDEQAIYLEYIGDKNGNKVPDIEEIGVKYLKGNGDFRSKECIELLKQADIVVTNPPFSCYSSDTEVFTNHGWKLFKDVHHNDLIMSINVDTNTSEFVGIRGFIEKTVDEDLVNFNTRYIDLLVTKDHRMIARKKDGLTPVKKHNGQELLIKAKNVKAFHTTPLKGFNWVGEHREFFTLPAVTQLEQYTRKETFIPEKIIRMEYWLEFFGFWLADGCTRTGNNSQGNPRYTVSIKQNEINEEYVKKLYSNIGFECKVERGKDGNNNYTCYSK